MKFKIYLDEYLKKLNEISVILLLIFGVLLVTIGNTFEFDLEQGFDDPMTKDSAKDGGLGFSKIAKSLGYETNTNIEAGDPRAKKGGTLTMLGGAEYPKTFRDIGKDSRSQINGLMAGIQYESLLAFDYESLELSDKDIKLANNKALQIIYS